MIEETETRSGKFAGNDPFALAQAWLDEARKSEINDPEAMALSTVDADGLPDVRMVLLKEIEAGGFVFYTNYGSAKAMQIQAAGKAALVLHWKSLRRQVRARGVVEKIEGPQADAYYASRSLPSRLGAWASNQSQPLSSRGALLAEVAKVSARHLLNPPRPPFWGGFRIRPTELEFWADGDHRLHDRFKWRRDDPMADAYYASRSLPSRLGAWASNQSQPLSSRGALLAEVAKVSARHLLNPPRPPFWGGFRIRPTELEFWADGDHRLHDRFKWRRDDPMSDAWTVQRLNP